jgi:hypothetical protein
MERWSMSTAWVTAAGRMSTTREIREGSLTPTEKVWP